MADRAGLTERVIAVLARHSHREPHMVRADEPLFQGGLELDSLAFLDVVVELEAQCGISLRSEELTLDTLATVSSFTAFLLDA